MTEMLVLSWQQIEEACDKLLTQLVCDSRPIAIAPVVRGGLVPATILSYAAQVPMTNLIDPRRPQILLGFPGGDGLLIVDDICDTGATIHKLRTTYPRARFAVLYAKHNGLVRCHHVTPPDNIVPQDIWVVFPWAPNDR